MAPCCALIPLLRPGGHRHSHQIGFRQGGIHLHDTLRGSSSVSGVVTFWVEVPTGWLAADAWPSHRVRDMLSTTWSLCWAARQTRGWGCRLAAAVTCLPTSHASLAAPQHQSSPLKAPLLAAEPAAGAVMCPPAFEGMSELKVEFQGHIMRLEQLIEHHGLREADPTGERTVWIYNVRAAALPITMCHNITHAPGAAD